MAETDFRASQVYSSAELIPQRSLATGHNCSHVCFRCLLIRSGMAGLRSIAELEGVMNFD